MGCGRHSPSVVGTGGRKLRVGGRHLKAAKKKEWDIPLQAEDRNILEKEGGPQRSAGPVHRGL